MDTQFKVSKCHSQMSLKHDLWKYVFNERSMYDLEEHL